MEAEQPESKRLVQTILVIDIDPSLSLFKPTQQKWVSSLELLAQPPRQSKNYTKIIHLTQGAFLQVGYCEKNRPPIYDIDFMVQPSVEWIVLKSPHCVSDKLGGTALCYKAGECPTYEPLTDIELLITERKRVNEEKEVFVLPPGFKIVNNNPINHSYLIYKRMRSPLEQTFKAILHEQCPEDYIGVSLAMMPLFCFPEGIHLAKELKGFINFNFILTTENGDRFYCNCLTFKENMAQVMKEALGLPVQDHVYYQKSLCLVSRHRYTDQFAECLKHLYRLSMSKNDVPFHQVVASFVDGLRLPKELGINGMSYSYGGSNITFDTNPPYPIISERSIYCIFKFLPLHAIISIFQAILLEKKVIFVSHSKTVLGYAVEAFLAFVFPFRWEHVLIPILPSTLREYTTAPVPLIVGITPQMLDRTIESDSIVVQLDSGVILNDQDLPPLPDKLQKQLRKRLQSFELYDEQEVKEYLQNPESTYIFKMQEVQHPQFHGHLVRDCFFQFMLTIMKNYRKFWVNINQQKKQQKYKDNKENSSIGLTQPQLLNDVFRLQDFLSDLGMTKVGSFGYKLTEATLFTSFIERRHQMAEQPQIRFFDQSIDRKKTKKEFTFIEKPTNIRYNVAVHPQPEKIKKVYQYQRFPSILDKAPVIESEIHMQVDTVNEEDLQILEQFLENEFCQNRRLFFESQSEDLDYKIESLLIEKLKLKYGDYCQITGGSKVENIRSSIVTKYRNSSQIYDKLKYFQKIYLEQMVFIEELFAEWPYEVQNGGSIREVDKKQYLKNCLGVSYKQDELVCLFQEYYGHKYRNYQTLILGSTRISLLQNRQDSRQVSLDNLRSSKKRIKYHYEIYIEHFKLKNFINRIIPQQGHAFFAFAIHNLHQNKAALWNLDTLLEWRNYLTHRKH